MSTKSRQRRLVVFLGVALIVTLACSVSLTPPQSPTGPDPTKMALELQSTAMSLELTQAAQIQAQSANAPAVPPAAPTEAPPPATEAPPPATEAPPAAPTQELAAPTQDVEARIKAAKVLLYEDTDELGIGQWIQDALDSMGLNYVQTGSFSGNFMQQLGSGKQYDLIIVGAENHRAITGEFWDVINTRLTRDKAALIVEVWYLNTESNGPISKILGPCGVSYRKQYEHGRVDLLVGPHVGSLQRAKYRAASAARRALLDMGCWGQTQRRRQWKRHTPCRLIRQAIHGRGSCGLVLRRSGDHPDVLQPRLSRIRHHCALAKLHPLHVEKSLCCHALGPVVSAPYGLRRV